MHPIPILLLALLLPLAAHAQMTWPLPACVERAALPKPAPFTPGGFPVQWSGACTTGVEVNAVGAAAVMFCPQPAVGGYQISMYAVRWSAVTSAMVADFAALPMAADKPAAIRAMQQRHATAHVWDMCDVWGPARERWNTAFAALPRVPAPSWFVAPFSVQTTRPAFLVVDGKRTNTSAGRANVGAACDCAAPIVEGSITFCRFAGGAESAVAVCQRK